MTLGEIAQLLNGAVVGDANRRVSGVAAPDQARPETLAVVWDRRMLSQVPPGVPILAGPGVHGSGSEGVEAPDPRTALALLLPHFAPPREFPPGVHPTAIVHRTAQVDAAAHVGPLCVLSEGAVVRAGAVLEAQVFVGHNVLIGERSRIEPLVAVYDDTAIGRDVLIHAGTIVGCDGFGFVPDGAGGFRKIPQVGRVVIEDDVELGAMNTVDRATLGETRIGRGVKTDDHVHIGHNCQIGKNCLLVAFTGLAGTTTLEDGVTMAARSGTQAHTTIGAGATVAGMAGVTLDVPPGAVVSGYPAQDHRRELRVQALLRKLPDLFDRVKRLEQRLKT